MDERFIRETAERIANSLELLVEELKTARIERGQFKQQLSQLETMIAEIAADPFSLSKEKERQSEK